MPAFDYVEKGYGALWNKAQVTPQGRHDALRFVQIAQALRYRYEHVQRITGCPWFVVAAIHMRESGLRVTGHLHNGDPLTARTVRVPKGRPKSGTPPWTWEESAVDALSVPPHCVTHITRWSTERILYELEKYNGWGYLGKTNSPYLWAGTDQYTSGKYIRDGVYDGGHVDRQLGCVAFLKVLAELDKDVAKRLTHYREAVPSKDVIKEEEKRGGKTGQIIVGTGGAATGGTGLGAAIDLPHVLLVVGISLGLAVMSAGVFLWIRGQLKAKRQLLERW